MMKYFALAAILLAPGIADACNSLQLQSFAVPQQIQVQTFAVPQVQTYAVPQVLQYQAAAVARQKVIVRQVVEPVVEKRTVVRERVRPVRRLRSRSVVRQSVTY